MIRRATARMDQPGKQSRESRTAASMEIEANAAAESTAGFLALNALASDAEQYARILQQLIRFFALHYCPDPSDLASETISRVFAAFSADKQKQLTSQLKTYILGVAKNVVLEDRRRQQRAARSIDDSDGDAPSTSLVREPLELEVWEQEKYLVCLERCLGELGTEQRRQILLFYEGSEEGELKRIRHELADELRTNTRALGLRMLRLRGILRACVGGCVEETQRRKTTESSLREERES